VAVRILFAGGGTGGHVYPALAVAKYLKRSRPDFEALFLGSRSGLEGGIVPGEGFPIRLVASRGFRRLGLAGRLRFFLSLARGLVEAAVVVRRWRPDLVLATGGHASLAGGLAAILCRRTLVVQEQNRIPGLATRLLGRLARRVYVGFPGTERAFRHPERVRFLGNPVRAELLGPHAPLAETGPGVPVVLVLGGSRGARSLNAAVAEAIPRVAERRRVTWLWQTGGAEHGRLGPQWSESRDVLLREYLTDMGRAYAAASLVVCRAGAMTLAELAVMGKPAVLVPFPGAVDDHQTANARYLVDAGAAVLLPDAELGGERLAQEVLALLDSPGRLEAMAAASRGLARPDATRRLAEELVELAGFRVEREVYVRTG
jgi:UDP-N-acetylglucosamine--N-acetylmuramyl-(pentapeptide) pyrophosphoryl-undecaprenol N-acetylglucosamine transferase